MSAQINRSGSCSNRYRLSLLCFWSFIIGFGIIVTGCRPSAREVANLLYKVPVGVSRDELRKVLVEAYGKRYPQFAHDYALVDPPRPVTDSILKADKELIFDNKKDHRYVRVFPPDLYEKLPSGALTEPVGIVAEASHGNGSVCIYYDSHTNYIGFLSFSSGMDSE